MTNPKPAKRQEPAPVSMDDIARKFLSTAPQPQQPKVKPAAKPTARKTNKPAE